MRPRADKTEKRTKWISMRLPMPLYEKMIDIATTRHAGNFTEAIVEVLCMFFWFQDMIEVVLERVTMKKGGIFKIKPKK